MPQRNKKPAGNAKAGAEHPVVAAAVNSQPLRTLLMTDSRLAKAVALIVGNCDHDARQLLLSEHPALTPKSIEMLSRTSPEYQRHVIERVRAGDAQPLKKTAACALVYETVSFREVISRLERALGALRREAAFLASCIAANSADLNRGPDRLLTLALVVEITQGITASIRNLPNTDGVQLTERRARRVSQKPAHAVPCKLNAASALGLLAKNARNLPFLKPEHHPNAHEQRQSLDLCEDITTLARSALRTARTQWGNLDAKLRARPKGVVTHRIITHADPDGDALAAAWLAERYLFGGAAVEILFVPRQRVLGCLRHGDCLVDVGNTFDPAQHLFDHKPPALASRHDSCAAKLVCEHLRASGKRVEHLEDLVLAVFAWDSLKRRNEFAQQAISSKRNSFHAAVDAAKRLGLNNADLYRHVRGWLDKRYPVHQ